jgi:HAD superfamily hydrolase (TIGR01549 family)
MPEPGRGKRRAEGLQRLPRAPRIEAVTFDFVNTLAFHPDRAARKRKRAALKEWLRSRGDHIERQALRSVVSTAEGIRAASHCGEERGGTTQASDYIVRALQLRITRKERAELEQLLEDLHRENRYCAAEGVVGVLRFLRSRGLRLGIVSNRGPNGGLVLRSELERIGAAGFFEPTAISSSDEVGFRKPDSRIFLSSLRALQVAPEQTAHVGNKKLTDIVGARRLGMLAVRYAGIRNDHDDAPEADVVIQSLEDLPRVLGLLDGRRAAITRSETSRDL